MCTKDICRPNIGQYSRLICWPSVSRYIDRYSAETRPTYRPTSTGTHVGRHPANTSLPLGQYFADTRPTLRSFAQLSLQSSIFSTQLRGAFSGCHPFLAFNFGNIHVFFPAMFFLLVITLYDPRYFLGLVAYGGSLF